jgi:hypothetical protein
MCGSVPLRRKEGSAFHASRVINVTSLWTCFKAKRLCSQMHSKMPHARPAACAWLGLLKGWMGCLGLRVCKCNYVSSYARVQMLASKLPHGTCIAPSEVACFPVTRDVVCWISCRPQVLLPSSATVLSMAAHSPRRVLWVCLVGPPHPLHAVLVSCLRDPLAAVYRVPGCPQSLSCLTAQMENCERWLPSIAPAGAAPA